MVLVVLNDGEIDIFYNFACSLRAHGLEAIMHKVRTLRVGRRKVVKYSIDGCSAGGSVRRVS